MSQKQRDIKERKAAYKFGSKKINVIKPSNGYPEEKEAAALPKGKLELSYVHGYNGFNPNSKNNLLTSNCGNYLIYNVAALVVVYDIKKKKQRYFRGHDDDVTSVALDRREGSTLVISGQTQPIDRPNTKRDLPNVWIWDLKDMSKVEKIDKVCYNYVSKVAWSPVTGYVYALAGDDEHTLKAFDPSDFNSDYIRVAADALNSKKKTHDNCNKRAILECKTMKEGVSGILVNPRTLRKVTKKKKEEKKDEKKDDKKDDDSKQEPAVEDETIRDEVIVFGKRKFVYIELREVEKTVNNQNLNLKEVQKSVVITKLNKQGEKAFTSATFLDNGYYAIGCSSGNIYINKGADAICLIEKCFKRSIGAMYWSGSLLYAGGFDKMFKTFSVVNDIKSCSGKNSKALKKETERYIDVYGSDMIFQPKGICYASKQKKVFIGVKSNQIVQIDEEAYLAETRDSGMSVIVDAHDGEVTSMDTHPELDLFITSGNDQSIKLWNAKKLKSIQTHEFIQDKGSKDEKKEDKKPTRTHNRSRSVSRGSLKTGKEIVKCVFSNDGKLIAFATEDSRVGVIVFEQFLIEKERFMKATMVQIPTKARASKNSIAYLRFSPCDKVLAVGHFAEQKIYNFTVERLKMNRVKLINWAPIPFHGPPMNIQWSKDSKIIRTLTRGCEVVYNTIDVASKKFKSLIDIPDPDDDSIQFYGEPLPAGWDTQALFQSQIGWETFSTTDCVFTDASVNNKKKKEKLLIGGDIYGAIRVFNYPGVKPEAHQEYNGHSQMIAGMGKLVNTDQVITCGGMDMAIFQWDIKYGKPRDDPKPPKKIKKKDDKKKGDEKKKDIKKKEAKKTDDKKNGDKKKDDIKKDGKKKDYKKEDDKKEDDKKKDDKKKDDKKKDYKKTGKRESKKIKEVNKDAKKKEAKKDKKKK